ncbi:MAG: hypothetical protein ACKOE7_10945, partial [Actinomycetota bacterium]
MTTPTRDTQGADTESNGTHIASTDTDARRVVSPRDLVIFERRTQLVIAAGVIVFTTLMVFLTLQPSLIFRNNTPTGGDMGAHVYGPAYLRDHLLTSLRL